MGLRQQLLFALDSAYDLRSWHGPNLRSAIRGVKPDEALWRPQPGRHNIWENVVHCAYWKYTVRRRIAAEKRGSFPLKGSNWFERSGPQRAAQWRSDLDLLEQEHRRLRHLIEDTPEERLLGPCGREYIAAAVIQGIAYHDVYHAGQIRLLRRLYAAAH